MDLGGLRAGLYVTPSSNPVKILDSNSLKFKFDVAQNDLQDFLQPVKVTIIVQKMKDKFEGTTLVPSFGNKGKFEIEVKLDSTTGLIPGLLGEITVY